MLFWDRREMNMPKVEFKNGSPADLQQALRDCVSRSAEARYSLRLVCLLLVAAGFSCAPVGRWFGKTGRTVERWVEAFQRHGIAGLRDEHRAGRAGEFNAEELACLADDLGRPPETFGLAAEEWTADLLAEHASRRYRHNLGVRQARRLLSRLLAEPAARVGGRATFISGRKDAE
jgi:transposase